MHGILLRPRHLPAAVASGETSMDHVEIGKLEESDFDGILAKAGGQRLSADESRDRQLNADYVLGEAVVELKLVEEEGLEKEERRRKVAAVFRAQSVGLATCCRRKGRGLGAAFAGARQGKPAGGQAGGRWQRCASFFRGLGMRLRLQMCRQQKRSLGNGGALSGASTATLGMSPLSPNGARHF